MKNTSNKLIGAKVVLDFGSQWKRVNKEFRDSAHQRVKTENKHFYGRTGIIVDYDRAELKVLVNLDDNGQLDWHYVGNATITEFPKDEAVEILQEILSILKTFEAQSTKREPEARCSEPITPNQNEQEGQ